MDKKSYYRATRHAVLLAAAGAAAGSLLFAGVSYSALVLEQSGTIAFLLMLAYAACITLCFRGRYWYYPVFIPVLWVPLSALAALPLALLPGYAGSTTAGRALFFYVWTLNGAGIAAAAALGMAVRGLIAAVRAFERRRL